MPDGGRESWPAATYSSTPKDDLLQPTLQEHQPAADEKSKRPWRLGSQIWLAILGGVVPITIVSFINARRLGMRGKPLWIILGIGCIAFVAIEILLAVWLANTELGLPPHKYAGMTEAARNVRWIGRLLGVVIYLVFTQMQVKADRLYAINYQGEEPHASLWLPGFIIFCVSGLIQIPVDIFIALMAVMEWI